MWRPPRIKTQRLILRPVNENDIEGIFSYASNPNVAEYTLWQPHQSIGDTREFFETYVLAKYSEKELEPLAISLKENVDQIIGTVGCFWNSKQSKVMELAYALSEEFWSQGIVTEAAKGIMDYSFQELDVNRIFARFKSENIASGKVMEKLGMTYEGCHRGEIYNDDRFWDMKYYSILRSEWKNLK